MHKYSCISINTWSLKYLAWQWQIPKTWFWAKFRKRVTWPSPHPLGDRLSSEGLIYSTCIQNLAILALAVPEIRLWASKLKMGYVTQTMSVSGVVCYPLPRTWYSLLVYKIDDSAILEISLGTQKFKMGHVTLITPILRVICYQYAGTWHSLHVFKVWPL